MQLNNFDCGIKFYNAANEFYQKLVFKMDVNSEINLYHSVAMYK